MAENELIVVEKLDALTLFTDAAMDPLVEEIRKKVLAHVPDVETVAGRKAVASLAFKVASSKVILDNLGKDLVADWKSKSKKVDDVRKKMRDDLDALRDQVRGPLTQWEQEQAAIEEQEQAAIEEQKRLDALVDAEWDEAHRMHDLFERERIVREKESHLARLEAERKAKEQAERMEAERKEREERIAREAAERAKREAEQAAERQRLEHEAALAREKARAEQAERDRIAAAERAKREQEEAVRMAEQRAREEAERRERERIAAEQAEKARQEKLAANRPGGAPSPSWAEKARQENLAANKRHRDRIEQDILEDLVMRGVQNGQQVLTALKSGLVRHVTINY